MNTFQKAFAKGEPIQVVITDLGMPYMDGQEVAEAVKRVSSSTPVVLLSGWGRSMSGDDSAAIHIDHTLAKPPRLPELRAVLAQCAKQLGE